MKLETIELSQLSPASYNPREISKEEFEGLKESLKTFGQQENLIVNKDMTIISGHQRYEAMKALKWTEAVCNMVDLDKHQEKKLNVIMNSTAISGKYDDLKLSEILEELKLDDDYESLRLDKLEPLDLSDIEVEEDEAPEVSSEPPVSKLGEVYQLGRHRVMCGDSTVLDNGQLLMNGKEADMVFTDPPYGVSALGGRRQTNEAKNIKAIENDDLRGERLKQFIIKSLSTLPIKKGAGIYICYGWKSQKEFTEAIQDLGWTARATITWVKNVFGLSAKNNYGYRPQTEFIYYATPTKEYDFSWYGGGTQSDVWNINRPTDREGNHPTPKPVELVAKAINNSSKSGDVIADLFLGSGSTLIACEQTDRTCYGMELDPKYVDVIRKRYWKFIHDGNEEGWEDGTKAI